MRLKIPLKNISRFVRSRPARSVNNSGLFGNVLLTSPKGFLRLSALVEERAVELVREIIRRNSSSDVSERYETLDGKFKTTVSMVDDLSNEICCAADLSDCIRNMHCDPSYSKAAEESMRKFTILVETLNTTPALYKALKNSLEREKSELDEVGLRTANLLLEDFEHSGVHMEEDGRIKFVDLSNSIFESSANFMDGVDRPAEITTAEAHRFGFTFNQLNGPWGSSSHYPLRKFTFTKYFEHSDTQENHLRRLIDCRTQLAKLTGFKTFAHRSQVHAILLNYDNVHDFLNGIIKMATPGLEMELETMRQIVTDNSKNFDPKVDMVGEWDVDFATSAHRHMIFDDMGENLKNFLYLDSVLNGFEKVINRLYGLSFQMVLPETGEIWPGNVIKLNVYRNATEFLGTIYLDVDSRPSKVQGDCHFTVRCSKLMDNGEYQTPIVVISLAIVPPELQNQNLGSFYVLENVRLGVQQAENFFHEMGHAIHSMLGRTRFQHVAGTRCPTDFAEVPSHLMECLFNDPRVLMEILKDKSGRSLTEDEAKALVSSRNLFPNVHLLQQTLYALFDLSVHGEYAEDVAGGKLTSTELFGKLADVALPGMGKIPNYAYHHRISHLVTYGAKYYSYLVARSSASLIYKNLFYADPFSMDNGLKWATIQSHGGEYPSHYLLEKVLGGAPNAQQLTSVLVGNDNVPTDDIQKNTS